MPGTKDQHSDSFGRLVGEVERLGPGPQRVPLPSTDAAPRQVHVTPTPRLVRVDRDEWVAAHAPDVPDSMAFELYHAVVPPVRELDLHRLNAARARDVLRRALARARADKIHTLIVVVGRGTHSGSTGPVLPQLVVEQLSGPLAAHVLALHTAPPQHGGAGAVIVRLRG